MKPFTKLLIPGVWIIMLIASGCGTSSQSTNVSEKPESQKSEGETLNWPETRTPFVPNEGDRFIGLDDAAHLLQKKEPKEPEPDRRLTLEKKGYRIQIYTTRDKTLADEIKNEAGEKYGLEAYIVFIPPNYNVRVGNFLDFNSAKKDMLELRSVYVNATVVPDFIEEPDSIQ